MRDAAETLYITLLRASNPSPEIQERAFEYAKNRKNSKVLLALIQVENLTEELDEKLGIDPSAYVLAEWIARKPRAAETLTNIVVKAKSQKVFKILAQQLNLDTDTYIKIAEKAEPESALALHQNPNVSKEIKLSLGPGLAKVSTHKDTKTLTQILDKSPNLLPSILNSPVITTNAWSAIVAVGHFPHEYHPLLVKRLRQEIEKGVVFKDSIIARILYKNYFSQNLLLELLEILKMKSASGQRVGLDSDLDKVKELIKGAADNEDLVLKIKNAHSQEAFEDLILRLTPDNRPVAPFIVMSPFFSIETAHNLYKAWSWGALSNLDEFVRDDPDKLFIIMAARPGAYRFELLDKIEDPEGMVTRLVNYVKDSPELYLYWFMESKYFNPELVSILSPSYIKLHSPLPDAAIKVLDGLLLKAFKDNTSAWDTFESLLGSHEGSIEDLIAVVVALCDLPEEE